MRKRDQAEVCSATISRWRSLLLCSVSWLDCVCSGCNRDRSIPKSGKESRRGLAQALSFVMARIESSMSISRPHTTTDNALWQSCRRARASRCVARRRPRRQQRRVRPSRRPCSKATVAARRPSAATRRGQSRRKTRVRAVQRLESGRSREETRRVTWSRDDTVRDLLVASLKMAPHHRCPLCLRCLHSSLEMLPVYGPDPGHHLRAMDEQVLREARENSRSICTH